MYSDTMVLAKSWGGAVRIAWMVLLDGVGLFFFMIKSFSLYLEHT